jgi:hypothetical protein
MSGNSHQRTVRRAEKNRFTQYVSEIVGEYFNAAPKELPWYESGLFWGCISLAAAIVLAVIAAMLRDFRWLLFIAWPLFEVSAWVACRRLKSKQIMASALVISGLIVGAVLLVLYVALSPKTEMVKAPPEVAIFASCDLMVLPISIPPETSLHVVSINKKFMRSQNWGIFDIPNRTDKLQQWPSKETIASERKKHALDKNYINPGLWGYKCDVSNHSQSNVFDVAVPIRFWFGDKGGDDNAIEYSPILSPIDANSHFIFYVVNDCPQRAFAILPETATLKVAGEDVSRTVRLNLPHRTPIEPFMILWPSKVQWVQAQPCEISP